MSTTDTRSQPLRSQTEPEQLQLQPLPSSASLLHAQNELHNAQLQLATIVRNLRSAEYRLAFESAKVTAGMGMLEAVEAIEHGNEAKTLAEAVVREAQDQLRFMQLNMRSQVTSPVSAPQSASQSASQSAFRTSTSNTSNGPPIEVHLFT
ncbi:hypothetical protein BASA60_007224 [Batrachochytrium salamandrivorans]|nr:hypothetical protein BASA60_007224 [Batrachochytrium salamandrivorans]